METILKDPYKDRPRHQVTVMGAFGQLGLENLLWLGMDTGLEGLTPPAATQRLSSFASTAHIPSNVNQVASEL